MLKMIPVHSLESEQESIIGCILEQKRKLDRNYSLVGQKGNEFYYLDEENHALAHFFRKEQDECFVIEIEQIEKETGEYHVAVYSISQGAVPIYSKPFESPDRIHAQGMASDCYRVLRDYPGGSICDLLHEGK